MVKDTVESLAEQVAAGTLDATEAGRRMSPLLTVLKPAVTLAEKRERYNEAAIETDPNSIVHVDALKWFGRITDKDYWAIRQGLGVQE